MDEMAPDPVQVCFHVDYGAGPSVLLLVGLPAESRDPHLAELLGRLLAELRLLLAQRAPVRLPERLAPLFAS